ncbi:MAG: GntR family transcriptional regulator [Victivallales bacterium]
MSTAKFKLEPISGIGRTESLCNALVALAEHLGPGGQFPTVRELARSLGVSLSTLDRVLHGLEDRGLIERRHGQGVFVGVQVGKKTIGVVSGFNIFELGTSPFHGMFIDVARHSIEKRGGCFRFYLDIENSVNGLPSHLELESSLKKKELSGIIFLGARQPEEIDWIKGFAIPMVSFTDCPHSEFRVYMDYPAMVGQCSDILIKDGCRRLALLPYWDGEKGALFSSCVEAFKKTMRMHRVAFKDELVWRRGKTDICETNEQQGWRAVMELFKDRPASMRPDGIVSTDDMMTRGAVAALAELGIRFGEEVRIATHANRGSSALDLYKSKLRMVEFDIEELIELLLNTLDRVGKGGKGVPKIQHLKPMQEN